jgi:hypothetical protein
MSIWDIIMTVSLIVWIMLISLIGYIMYAGNKEKGKTNGKK